MKILHLISGGDTGGAKTHVINLLTELQNKIDVKLICFLKEDFYYELKEKGVNIEVFEQKKRYDFSVIRRLINELKEGQYDLIHSHGARANFITFMLTRFYNIPTVTTIHSDYLLDFKGNFYKNIVYKNINLLSLKSIDYYIGVSKKFHDMMVERGFQSDKVFTIYNGIDVKNVPKTIKKEDFLKKYGIETDENTVVVGILARLHPVKGVDVFLRGAKKVLEQRDDVIFLIGGDGIEKDNLIELANDLGISEKVYFLGFIEKPYDFLNSLDINTITSFSESFTYTILEGGILKKPIVASNVGGLNDLVIENKTGLLFEAGNEELLCQKLLKLIDNKEMRTRFGNNLYQSICDKFSSSKMADKQISIYKEILSRQVDK